MAAQTKTVEVRNWFGDVASSPQRVVEATSADEIAADGGTVVDMGKMNRILDVGQDTVTVEAGALYIDVAKELERRGHQFHVHLEIGTATMGSLACCTTKDSSMPGELGNPSSYCVGMKLVTASGERLEVTEADPELMCAARSSSGLLGIVYEATFKIRPLQVMAVRHGVYRLEEFLGRLPELAAGGESMMWYGFPHIDRVVVEFRKYVGEAATATTRANHGVWRLRNFVWKTFAPSVGVAQRAAFRGAHATCS